MRVGWTKCGPAAVRSVQTPSETSRTFRIYVSRGERNSIPALASGRAWGLRLTNGRGEPGAAHPAPTPNGDAALAEQGLSPRLLSDDAIHFAGLGGVDFHPDGSFIARVRRSDDGVHTLAETLPRSLWPDEHRQIAELDIRDTKLGESIHEQRAPLHSTKNHPKLVRLDCFAAYPAASLPHAS